MIMALELCVESILIFYWLPTFLRDELSNVWDLFHNNVIDRGRVLQMKQEWVDGFPVGIGYMEFTVTF